MNKYLVEIWFRYGVDQQDFEQLEIDADTQEEAESIAKDLRNLVFKVETLKINDEPVKETQA